MTITPLMTADELPGELRKTSPKSAEHGDVTAAIITSMRGFVKAHGLGTVYASSGFEIARNPDTVLAPDAAFVRHERVVKTRSYFEGPPDIAVEVVSPGDTYMDVDEKTLTWFRAGAQVVIIVNPEAKRVWVHRADGAVDAVDAIAVDDIISGWHMPLTEVFESLG